MAPATDRTTFTTSNLRAVTLQNKIHTSNCAICQENYNKNHTPVRIVDIAECSHVFGSDCINSYIHALHANSNKCPLCRAVWYNVTRQQALSQSTASRRPTREDRAQEWSARGAEEREHRLQVRELELALMESHLEYGDAWEDFGDDY
ncbi:hypothetical protein CC78DRAFT_579922 [Lojkania enalia]|uniref:RING-type domain-containing protein n=1 Tax=Lojkania enalia TaxID=147567 RepID=A0A9P4K913_9PLEO|nr:hypothetical protein CC78DRAFT_579922 [Didymosphaeria enalia]